MGRVGGAGLMALVAMAAGCGPATVIAEAEATTVVAIIDGDTIDVSFAGVVERVRLLGIDTPETVSPVAPVQCFGPEATEAVGSVIPPGTEVRLERDLEARDRYGRLLLYLYRAEDGLFVNEWLVAGGYATALLYEPNTTMATPLLAAERQARRDHVGLWAACDGPNQPLD